MDIHQKLKSLHACEAARIWAEGKTLEQIWQQCHRGDWMLWLFERADNFDKRKITLAAGHIASTVLHLMDDGRSHDAVRAAIWYGYGRIDDNELAKTRDVARDPAWATAWYAARPDNLKLYADICRKYLPLPIFKDVH